MDKILLEVTGTQNYGPDVETVELSTIGTLRDDGVNLIFRYTEEHEAPESPVKVTIRINKKCTHAQIDRDGEHKGSLYIEKNTRHSCQYGSPMGDLMLGVYGKDIELISESNTNGLARFNYSVDFNGSVTSENEVTLKYKKQKTNRS